LETIGIEDVREYYRGHFGCGDTIMCVVGDIESASAERLAADFLGDWPAKTREVTYPDDLDPESETSLIRLPMPDRPNVDVRMGHGVAVRRTADEYLPLYAGNFALGGNFSARLMRVIRDQLGLTYGISSSLVGLEREHGGHLRVAVTLSTDRLEEGIDRTLEEIRAFLKEGVSASQLEAVKTTVAGSYKVGLNSTRGISSALLTNAERGFEPGYLDAFPKMVLALTPANVNDVLRSRVKPDLLEIAVAGTLE
jgi:predicted Zn-dependent peptidase